MNCLVWHSHTHTHCFRLGGMATPELQFKKYSRMWRVKFGICKLAVLQSAKILQQVQTLNRFDTRPSHFVLVGVATPDYELSWLCCCSFRQMSKLCVVNYNS